MKRGAGICFYLLLAAATLLSTGCRHVNRAAAVPAAPPMAPPPPLENPTPPAEPRTPALADNSSDRNFVRTHKPIYSEVGLASWYGPPYDKRRAANGEVYDQDALTAAHRTLPLGSLIKVTNLSTGQSAVMRITDRGPFVPGRILDLSRASAKAVGVWKPGIARVRVDVYATPSPLDQGGRWCVQVGAFQHGAKAVQLRDLLMREYRSASVIEFPGPTGYWVRIRPPGGVKEKAAEIARTLKPQEGAAYLVRLD